MMNLKIFRKPQPNGKIKNRRKRRSGIISPIIQPDSNSSELSGQLVSKTPEEEKLISLALRQNKLLNKVLHGKYLQTCIDCMYNRNVFKGETLTKHGELDNHLYISEKGTFEVLLNDRLIETFQDVRVFGELALFHSTRRQTTIRTAEDGSIWVLNCSLVKHLTVSTVLEEQEELVALLKHVPKFKVLDREKLYKIANLLQVETFPTSEAIISEGDEGSKFYLIKSGTATVMKRNVGFVKTLVKGDFFGEVALFKEYQYAATVTANSGNTICLTLTRNQFLNNFREFDSVVNVKKLIKKNSVVEFETLDLRNFTILSTLGVGGFGRVELVQHNQSKDTIFALKYIKKSEVSGQSQQSQIFNEKQLQMACNNPFMVRLYRTYRDTKYIYFLLEPCLGGDLWNLLKKQKNNCFEEDAVRFYAGCVVEAYSYLHDNDIIYRDLKPENVMVDSNGYLKLTDFGFAKKVTHDQKSFTFVGTAEYVAPEIIQSKGHGKGVDFWSLGVFIYELLVGKSPFLTNDQSAGDLKIYKQILKGIDYVFFPYSVPPRARNIVKKLCRPRAEDRLGCLKDGVKDVQNHPWYSRLDWDQLRSLQMTPPLKIHLSSNTDTRYFEKFKEDKDVPVDDYSTWDADF